MTKKLQFTELSNNGDARGFSFTAPAEALAFVGRTADVHLASTGPGAVRGNHYHLRRREAIVVTGTRAKDRSRSTATSKAHAQSLY
ncbi:MAG: hypothetical protein DMG79_21935 [Acidobacteria bacterium]|nr:MAG: hypothetical protein DMG79_21935 [Acidobacteriota bacterium]